MDVSKTLSIIKRDYEETIKTTEFNGKRYSNGLRAKEALIRSQKIINYLHELVKVELIKQKINPKKIWPRIGQSKPEIKIQGFLKAKNQDICVIPEDVRIDKNRITEVEKTERVITINVRSQLSSLAKNVDTLFERTFAEALNIHLKHPKQCLGEVYLIPTHEYDDVPMINNRIVFKRASRIEEYIKMFQSINGRIDDEGNEYKYERVCLLIVDFRQDPPKLYSRKEELIIDGLIASNSDVTMKNLTIKDFAKDLLEVYNNRFNIDDLH